MSNDRTAVAAQRANAAEARTKRFVMLLSEDDHARIKVLARERGVSMARLLQESALSESYDRRERLAIVATLNRQERLLGNLANNINQLAHHANMAQQIVTAADLEEALAQVRNLRDEVAETLRHVR